MIEKKVEGQEVKAVAPAPRRTSQVVDIFAALKKEPRGSEAATSGGHAQEKTHDVSKRGKFLWVVWAEKFSKT